MRGMQQYFTLARIHQQSVNPNGRNSVHAPSNTSSQSTLKLPGTVPEDEAVNENFQGKQQVRPSRSSRIIFDGGSRSTVRPNDKEAGWGRSQLLRQTIQVFDDTGNVSLDPMRTMLGAYDNQGRLTRKAMPVPKRRDSIAKVSAKQNTVMQDELVSVKKSLYDSMKSTFHRRVWRDCAVEGARQTTTRGMDSSAAEAGTYNSSTADDGS
jgi:hypothetical protein